MRSDEINGPVRSGELFVFYGLLKRGAAGMPAHIDLEAAGTFLGPCRFRGAMYHLGGGYPGVVDGTTLCHGVRYRLDDPNVAAALDEFEDVVVHNRAASLYVRRKIPLLDDDGAPTGERAWVYWYNQAVDGRPAIETGDWPLAAGEPQR